MKIFDNILKMVALSSLLFAMSACTKPGPDDGGQPEKEAPAFPALIENYSVHPGEVLKITFTPNYDWEVSVPSEMRQWFWIKDGSFTVTNIRGTASETPVTVEVCVTDNDEFDKNFSCEVTMKMDSQTKVVAKYMLPAKERTLSVYAAEWNDDGSLKIAEDGESYVYSMVETSSFDLKWSAADADFRAPVAVEANCEWEVELPEWLATNVPETTSGVVELVFTGVSLEDASGKVVFKAGGEVLKELDVTVPSCSEMNVYSAVVTDGEFEYGTDGEYLWTDDAVEEVTLAWLGSDFRMPVKIDSKCDWTLEAPVWITAEIPEETAGLISLTLMGNPSKYPLEDTSGKLVFKMGDDVVHEMTVNIPGCREIMTYSVSMALTELDFNHVGQIKASAGFIDGPVTATIFGSSESDVFAVEYVNGKYDLNASDNPEWLDITVGSFDSSDNADVLQSREVTVSVKENEGDERSALLFFMPYNFWGKLSNLFNDEKTEVKEEFKAYAVPVRQLSNDSEYITPSSADEVMAAAGAEFGPAADDRKTELTSVFGETKYVYTLVYDNIYARDEAFLAMARPFTSVKVFDQDKADRSSDESFWLKYTNGGDTNTFGVIDMYAGEDMTLPEEPSVGYVVFYDSLGNVLAIVECISPKNEEPVVTPPEEGGEQDEDGDMVESASSFFTDPSAAAAAGASIVKVLSGPTYDFCKEEISQGATLLKLTLPENVAVGLSLPEDCGYYQMPYSLSSYIKVNGEDYSETSGILNPAITSAEVSMTSLPDGNSQTPYLRFHTSMSETYPFLIVYLYISK
ncbi:MAG: hypothetical protein II989_06790 [Bacteroidales bacterium]|nr:hypothetical protein [Bacteroidales bacterium]